MRISDDTWALIIPGLMLLVFCISIGALLVPTTPVHAQTTVGVGAIGDPCQDARILKSSAVVNVVSATTTQLVALSGTAKVYVCGGSLTIVQSATTADTAVLEYGTGASCGTGTTTLTGAFGAGLAPTTPAALTPIIISTGATSMSSAPGNALCLLSAGTTVNIQGYVTYVQQ